MKFNNFMSFKCNCEHSPLFPLVRYVGEWVYNYVGFTSDIYVDLINAKKKEELVKIINLYIIDDFELSKCIVRGIDYQLKNQK